MNELQRKFMERKPVEPDFTKIMTAGELRGYVRCYGERVRGLPGGAAVYDRSHEAMCVPLKRLPDDTPLCDVPEILESFYRGEYSGGYAETYHLKKQYELYERDFINGYKMSEVVVQLAGVDLLSKAYRIALAAQMYSTQAKVTGKDKLYKRKNEYMHQLVAVCRKHGWRYGYQHSDMMYVPYILYFDLPGCGQISFHSTFKCDREYRWKWDGRINSTFPKLHKAISEGFSDLFPVRDGYVKKRLELKFVSGFMFPSVDDIYAALENVGTVRKFCSLNKVYNRMFIEDLFKGSRYGLNDILSKKNLTDDMTFEQVSEIRKRVRAYQTELRKLKREREQYENEHHEELERQKVHDRPARFTRDKMFSGFGMRRMKLLLNRLGKTDDRMMLFRLALECVDSYTQAYYELDFRYQGKMFAKYHGSVLDLCRLAYKSGIAVRVFYKESSERKYPVHPHILIDIDGVRLCLVNLFFKKNEFGHIEECGPECVPEDSGNGQIYRLERLLMETLGDKIKI